MQVNIRLDINSDDLKEKSAPGGCDSVSISVNGLNLKPLEALAETEEKAD